MGERTGVDALIHVVAAQWCIGYTWEEDGEDRDFRRFIPRSGTVTADQFVDWVFRGSSPDALETPALEQRARADIRAAFVRHMGGEAVDAAALHWPHEHLPIPDPEAFARNLTAEELLGWRDLYGEDSRDWIIAQNELRRRRRWLSPLATQILWGAAALFVVFYFALRWFRP